MPGYKNMNELLKSMAKEQPRRDRYQREGLGAFRRRLEAPLNGGADVNLLDQSLPEKFRRYRTTPQEQAERKKRSQRLVTKKVAAHTAQVDRRFRAMPFALNQADSALRYYLTSSGQLNLADQYENVMASSTETLEEAERKFRVEEGMSREAAEQKALEKQDARRRARGALLTRLLEPLSQTSPQRLADLTDEEAESHYGMYHAMLELVRVLEEPLEADEADSEILFTPEERETCRRALDFLEPLEKIELQTNLICNPYYPYLNTREITRSVDVKAGSIEADRVFANTGNEYLKIFGADLNMAVTETKREAVNILMEELKNRGFDPENARYTRMVEPPAEEGETAVEGIKKPKPREEEFEPDSEYGIDYIYGGGKFLVTQGTRQVEMSVQMDRTADGIERENLVLGKYTDKNIVLEIRKTVRQLRMRGTDIRYTRPDGGKLDFGNPKDMEYLNDGGEVMITADNAQVILSVDRKNNYHVSCSYTPEHARLKMRERVNYLGMEPDKDDYTREDGREFDLEDPENLKEFCNGTPLIVTSGEQQVCLTYNKKSHSVDSEYTELHRANEILSEAADVNKTKWEAQSLYRQLRESYENNLKTVSDLVKDADPALLKSSEQYKRMRSSLKELKELLKEQEIQEPGSDNVAESMRRLKLLTNNVYNAANDYLIYKGTGTTTYARRRVEAAKAVKEFADQQSRNLTTLAYMDTKIRNAKNKDSLETLLEKKVRTEEEKFRAAGTAYALENSNLFTQDKISKTLWMKLSADLNKDLYHKLDLDLPGSRKTPLSEEAKKEAQELLGYMVLETIYRDDLKKYSADETQVSPLTKLLQAGDINSESVLKLATETEAFQQKLESLTRDRLYRFVTEPDHKNIKELADTVRTQVTQEAADKVVEAAQKKDEEMKQNGVKPKAVIVGP